MNSNELIKQARELCDATTQGPWKATWGLDARAMVLSDSDKTFDVRLEGHTDAAFIAASRTLVPQLCDALEAADKRERWIPVKERLPDDVGSYLVYYHEWSNGDFLPKYDDYRIRVMRFLNNGKWFMPVCTDKRCEADTNREVTHWMTLPKMPKEENDA